MLSSKHWTATFRLPYIIINWDVISWNFLHNLSSSQNTFPFLPNTTQLTLKSHQTTELLRWVSLSRYRLPITCLAVLLMSVSQIFLQPTRSGSKECRGRFVRDVSQWIDRIAADGKVSRRLEDDGNKTNRSAHQRAYWEPQKGSQDKQLRRWISGNAKSQSWDVQGVSWIVTKPKWQAEIFLPVNTASSSRTLFWSRALSVINLSYQTFSVSQKTSKRSTGSAKATLTAK